jgi:hypothetical protein
MAVDLLTYGILTLEDCASGALRTLQYIAHIYGVYGLFVDRLSMPAQAQRAGSRSLAHVQSGVKRPAMVAGDDPNAWLLCDH